MVLTGQNNSVEHDHSATHTDSKKTLQQLCNVVHFSQLHMLLLPFLVSLSTLH
jgi:hypothetical protein